MRLSVELKNKLTNWYLDVQNKKKKKYIRDFDDFKNGNIFKWQNTGAPSPIVLDNIPNHTIADSPLPTQSRNFTYSYDYPAHGPTAQRDVQAYRGNNEKAKQDRRRRGGTPKRP